jgi:hypothetical protein
MARINTGTAMYTAPMPGGDVKLSKYLHIGLVRTLKRSHASQQSTRRKGQPHEFNHVIEPIPLFIIWQVSLMSNDRQQSKPKHESVELQCLDRDASRALTGKRLNFQCGRNIKYHRPLLQVCLSKSVGAFLPMFLVQHLFDSSSCTNNANV